MKTTLQNLKKLYISRKSKSKVILVVIMMIIIMQDQFTECSATMTISSTQSIENLIMNMKEHIPLLKSAEFNKKLQESKNTEYIQKTKIPTTCINGNKLYFARLGLLLQLYAKIPELNTLKSYMQEINKYILAGLDTKISVKFLNELMNNVSSESISNTEVDKALIAYHQEVKNQFKICYNIYKSGLSIVKAFMELRNTETYSKAHIDVCKKLCAITSAVSADFCDHHYFLNILRVHYNGPYSNEQYPYPKLNPIQRK